MSLRYPIGIENSEPLLTITHRRHVTHKSRGGLGQKWEEQARTVSVLHPEFFRDICPEGDCIGKNVWLVQPELWRDGASSDVPRMMAGASIGE